MKNLIEQYNSARKALLEAALLKIREFAKDKEFCAALAASVSHKESVSRWQFALERACITRADIQQTADWFNETDRISLQLSVWARRVRYHNLTIPFDALASEAGIKAWRDKTVAEHRERMAAQLASAQAKLAGAKKEVAALTRNIQRAAK